MKIVIINSPGIDDIDWATRRKHYWSFFGQGNIDGQWKVLEGMRETGGLIMAQPCGTSALHELIEPYLDEEGFVVETGYKVVSTKEHGEFEIFLYDAKRSFFDKKV